MATFFRCLSLLFLCVGFLSTPSLAYNRGNCQAVTRNPLQGCPAGTILVGPGPKYTTIQSAVLSLPNDTTPHTILILPGNYTEQVNVTRPGPITMLGQTNFPNDNTKNSINVIWHNATGTNTTGTYDNLYTSTLTIAPTLNASATGSGTDGNPVPPGTPFGNTNFRAYNLNFVNDYLPYSAGPSLALSVSYANAGFYYCGFYSYQDTIYVGKLGSTYMYNTTIAGQTDFFYGFGTLWVQSSAVKLRGCGGGITAWKGTNTTFVNKYGVYIHDSTVEKANSSLEIAGKCALGRPWNAQMRAVFANNYLDDSIQPNGYIEWESSDPRIDFNTTQAEYGDYGPGFNLTARLAANAAAGLNITIEFTPEQYEPYSTPAKVFEYPFSGVFGNTAWIDEHPQA